MVKTNANGYIDWEQGYNAFGLDDKTYDITPTSDGGWAMTGFTDAGSGNLDVLVIKTSATGILQWMKRYGGASDDIGRGITQTSDGGYAIGGYTESFGAGFIDFYMLKLDSLGNLLWTKTFGGNTYDVGYHIIETADNGLVMIGSTESYGVGSSDFMVVKTNAAGVILWFRTYGGTGEDICLHVHQNNEGNLMLTGRTTSFGFGSRDILLVEARDQFFGIQSWARAIGTTSWEEPWSVDQFSDGSYVVGGYTTSGAGGRDAMIARLDTNGYGLCNTMCLSSIDQGGLVQSSSGGVAANVGQALTLNLGSMSFSPTVGLMCSQPTNPEATFDTINNCPGDSVLLSLNGTYLLYQWSNGATTSTITVAPNVAQTYTVWYRGQNDCPLVKYFTVEPGCTAPATTNTHSISTTTAILAWDSVECASHYEIQGRRVGATTFITLSVAGHLQEKPVGGLTQLTSYQWQVRAVCVSGTTTYSPWSPMETFTTLLCHTPDSIWTNPVTSNAARLNWIPESGATGYRITGQRLGGVGLTQINIPGGNTSFKNVFGLWPGTSYYWTIQALCDAGNAVSGSTALDTFTTANTKFEKLGEISNGFRKVSLTPNPTKGKIEVRGLLEDKTEYKVYDLTGVLVSKGNLENSHLIDISSLSPNLYLVTIGEQVFKVMKLE